jgi:transposase
LEAKVQVVEWMEAGHTWQEALTKVGVRASGSTAYGWRQKWRADGQAALVDGRHGYRHKLSDAIRGWLQATCEAAPYTPSSQLKQELQTRFGVEVSQGHIYLVRAQLGVSRSKKSPSGSKRSGRKAPAVCSSQLQPRKRN